MQFASSPRRESSPRHVNSHLFPPATPMQSSGGGESMRPSHAVTPRTGARGNAHVPSFVDAFALAPAARLEEEEPVFEKTVALRGEREESTGGMGLAPPRSALRDQLLGGIRSPLGGAGAGGGLGSFESPRSPIAMDTDRQDVRPEDRSRVSQETREEGSCWVTIFGFRPEQVVDVLHHFALYGEIVQHTSGGENWLHVQYAEPIGAQAALAKSGRVFFGGLMLGVMPADGVSAAAAAESVGGVRRAMASDVRAPYLTAAPAPTHARSGPRRTTAMGMFLDFVLGTSE